MEKNEFKLINVGDTFMINLDNFEYYTTITDPGSFEFEDEIAWFGTGELVNDIPSDDLEKAYEKMLLVVKYLGNGRVQEMSTGRILPIYHNSSDFRLVDGIYKKPNGYITTSVVENIKEMEMADKFLNEADEFKMAVVIYNGSMIHTDIENYLSQYGEYNLEQRKVVLDMLEKYATKYWEEDKKDFIDILDEQKNKGMRSNS